MEPGGSEGAGERERLTIARAVAKAVELGVRMHRESSAVELGVRMHRESSAVHR